MPRRSQKKGQAKASRRSVRVRRPSAVAAAAKDLFPAQRFRDDAMWTQPLPPLSDAQLSLEKYEAAIHKPLTEAEYDDAQAITSVDERIRYLRRLREDNYLTHNLAIEVEHLEAAGTVAVPSPIQPNNNVLPIRNDRFDEQLTRYRTLLQRVKLLMHGKGLIMVPIPSAMIKLLTGQKQAPPQAMLQAWLASVKEALEALRPTLGQDISPSYFTQHNYFLEWNKKPYHADSHSWLALQSGDRGPVPIGLISMGTYDDAPKAGFHGHSFHLGVLKAEPKRVLELDLIAFQENVRPQTSSLALCFALLMDLKNYGSKWHGQRKVRSFKYQSVISDLVKTPFRAQQRTVFRFQKQAQALGFRRIQGIVNRSEGTAEEAWADLQTPAKLVHSQAHTDKVLRGMRITSLAQLEQRALSEAQQQTLVTLIRPAFRGRIKSFFQLDDSDDDNENVPTELNDNVHVLVHDDLTIGEKLEAYVDLLDDSDELEGLCPNRVGVRKGLRKPPMCQ